MGGGRCFFGHAIVVAVKMGLVEFSGQPSEAYSQKRITFNLFSAVRKINSFDYILL